MKKTRFVLIALCLILVLGITAPAGLAVQESDYVADYAEILTESEFQNLTDEAGRISAEYGCSVFIFTAWDYREFGAADMEDFANSVYESMQIGTDGVLLVLSMAERDFQLLWHGDFAHYAYTDAAREKIKASFLDDFKDNDWADGFEDYLKTTKRALKAAAKGKPIEDSNVGISVTAGVVCAAVIAFIVCQVFKSQMKTAVAKTEASHYVEANGVSIDSRSDHFTHTTTTRRKIKSDDNDSTGGGSSGSSSSGGSSSEGGKF